MSSLTGKILGNRYRLVQPLHEGGMGAVWLAEHLSLASPLAVKLMAPEVAKTEERLQRFLREARTAAALRSPHVVQVFDHGVEEGTPFIAMELLQGESLAERLRRLGRLAPRETELVIRHVSRAIGQAHDIGIVHRDLTPANIFITRNADEEVIKLLDFGIAKATDLASASFSKQTRTGSFLGTPAYVSPEQLEESKSCDHRTDIWAMGVIAFECLLGHMPFGGAGIGGLVMDICSRPLPRPSEHGAVPDGFDAWFPRACARELKQRFASAREAAQALRVLVEPARGSSQHAPIAPVAVATTAVSNMAPEAPAHDARAPFPAEPSHASTLRSSTGISITSAASSVTLDQTRARRHVEPGALLLLTAAFLVVLFVWRALARSPAEAETVRALQASPAAAPVAAAAAPNPATVALDPGARAQPVAPILPLEQGLAARPLAAQAPAALPPAPARPPEAALLPGPAPPPAAPLPDPSTAPAGSRASRSGGARQAPAPKATLTLESTPDSAVLLDGAPLGTTPLRAVPVAPGRHRILFIRGAQRQARNVKSVAGQHRVVSASFAPTRSRR